MSDQFVFGKNHFGLEPATEPGTTDANGSWPDAYTVCTPYCPSSGQSVAAPSWTYNGVPLPHANTVVYKCSSISIDGF